MLLTWSLVLVASPVLPRSDHVVHPGESVNQAILGADDGDRILVLSGTYFENVSFHGRAVEVIGVAGAASTVLDGSRGFESVVRFDLGEGPDSVLRGFTIRNGSTLGLGGGVSTYPFEVDGRIATPRIEDCVIRDNTAHVGGGGVAGRPELVRCAILDNDTFVLGGAGIWGAPRMRLCLVADNFAHDGAGGGIYVQGGPTLIEDCVVVDNVSDEHARGGGIFVEGGSAVVLRRLLVAGNHSSAGFATARGAGVFCEEGTSVTVEACTIADNRLFGFNEDAGGIQGPAKVRDSIVWGNDGSQLLGVLAVAFCDVEGGAPGSDNLSLDPVFVDAADWDYHLAPGSPCIDAGAPTAFDLDGTRRDLGASPFRRLYADDNAGPEHRDAPTWPEVPVALGGGTRFRLRAGARHAGSLWVLLGSLGPPEPGIRLFGATLPLADDAYLRFGLNHPDVVPYADSLGTLDASGSAEPLVLLPGSLLPPALADVRLYHAAVVFAPGTLEAALVAGPEVVGLVP